MKVNQKDKILSKYVDILSQYKYVSILHTNKLSSNDLIKIKNQFRRVKLKIVHNNLLKNALKNTNYRSLAPFIVGPNIILYTNENGLSDIKTIMSNNKETISLLFMITEGTILQKNEFSLWLDLKLSGSTKSSLVSQLKANQASVHNTLKTQLSNLVFYFKQGKGKE